MRPLSEDKKEAQYFFNNESVRLIVDTLQSLKFTHVICLGAPSIFEYLGDESRYAPRRLLMDLDSRFAALLGPLEFVWFNMMNFYFFHADSGKSVYKDFLSELGSKGSSLAIVLDPPFGARHEILSASLRRILRDAKRISDAAATKIFWIFPYFMEKKLVHEADLGLRMCDYRVGYANHKDYSGTVAGRKQGSPVRIFTNVPLRQVQDSLFVRYR